MKSSRKLRVEQSYFFHFSSSSQKIKFLVFFSKNQILLAVFFSSNQFLFVVSFSKNENQMFFVVCFSKNQMFRCNLFLKFIQRFMRIVPDSFRIRHSILEFSGIKNNTLYDIHGFLATFRSDNDMCGDWTIDWTTPDGCTQPAWRSGPSRLGHEKR